MMNLLKKLFRNRSSLEGPLGPWEVNIDELLGNREAFNEFVYTPLEQADLELERRWKDINIPAFGFIPDQLKDGFKAVMFRQVVTANYEMRRFVNIVDALKLEPVFWEYHQDKFTSNNEWKHSLGKLFFYRGQGKKGGAKIDSMKIIDFNAWNGKPLANVRTLWDEPLVDFHHTFFKERFREMDASFFDASEWFHENGMNASSYYKSFVSLFLKHGILFENFMIDEKEIEFTRHIFLPAFIEVWRETGLKPLIVSLEPTDIEDDLFWLCHPNDDREYVESRHARMIESSL